MVQNLRMERALRLMALARPAAKVILEGTSPDRVCSSEQ
jgi:hypothetical protein